MRTVLALALLATACKKQTPEEATPLEPLEPAATEAPPATAPEAPLGAPDDAPDDAPEGVDAMVRALAARDAAPACHAVESLSPTPVEALQWMVAEVPMPPQVPMRAAGCLIGHGEAVRDDLLSWVREPAYEGLGRLVLQRVPDLPAELAADVIAAAREGALAEAATDAAAADPRLSVE